MQMSRLMRHTPPFGHPSPRGDGCRITMMTNKTKRPLPRRPLSERGAEFDYAAFQAVKQGSDVDVFADLMSCYCNSLFGVQLPYDAARLKAKGLEASDFDRLYLQCHERHKRAFVRVVRRSWKYLRYGRLYRAIYGQSMFRRFYLHNVGVALRQHI